MADRVAPIGPAQKTMELESLKSATKQAQPSDVSINLALQIAASRPTQATAEATRLSDKAVVVGAGAEAGKTSLLAQRIFLGLAVSRKRERKRRLRKAFDHAFDRFSEEDDPLPQERALFAALLESNRKSNQYPMAMMAKRLVIEFEMHCRRKSVALGISIPKNASTVLAKWLRKNLKPLLRLLDILYYSEPGIALEYAESAESFLGEVVATQSTVSQMNVGKPILHSGTTKFYERTSPKNAVEGFDLHAVQEIVAQCKTWPEFLARYSYIRSRTIFMLNHYPN